VGEEEVSLLDPQLEFAVATVRTCGEILLKYFQTNYAIRQKSKDNPVTPADLEADKYLRETFTRRFPEDGWLSEETVDSPHRMSRKRVWVVDPLDGTKEFVKGLPEFAISVALVEDNSPRIAVIYNPARDDLFAAAKNVGAWRGGSIVKVSTRSELQGSRVFVSRSEHSDSLFGSLQQSATLRSVGSIAYKLALVAAGEADISISMRPKNEWDVCAGALLVQEAGGVISDLDGNPLEFNRQNPLINGIIAANPSLHAQATKWVNPDLRTTDS
jgi:myo-inositol-1(or 4)-monophosphatase